jgi:hypothetical protein
MLDLDRYIYHLPPPYSVNCRDIRVLSTCLPVPVSGLPPLYTIQGMAALVD